MPKSAIPMLPVLSGTGWSLRKSAHYGSVLDDLTVTESSSGSAALFLALQAMSLRDGDEVLVPAYNCRAMREPATASGANVVLYHVNADLSPDLEDIGRRVTSRARALLVPHYFGFAQDLEELTRFCADQGLALIEDCAHSFIRRADGSRIGDHGDFVIASATKFFPVAEGGYLGQRSPTAHVHVHATGVSGGLRALFDAVDIATTYGRLRLFKPVVKLLKGVFRRFSSVSIAQVRATAQTSDQYQYFQPEKATNRMAWTSRAITKFYSPQYAAKRRCENYVAIADALRNRTTCSVLYARLLPGTVPYMVPVVLNDPEPQFQALQREGFPMYRWEDCGASTCPVTAHYTRALIHVPIHEQLSNSELDSMMRILNEVLA